MITIPFEKLKRINPWHFIWISIVSSELITLVLSIAQGRLWWGRVSRETLLIGAVDALVVPLIVATLVIYFVKSITELNELNEQLQEANRKLKTLDAMKTDFVSIVSHELRTPLTTIKAFVELLKMKPDMPAAQRDKLVRTISTETDRLTRLTADLLELSLIEEGVLKWRMEYASLEDIIRGSMTGMGPLFENKGIRITDELCSQLPLVWVDKDRIFQVITNILSNALKFTPSGGTIHVAARRLASPRDEISIEIADSGIGIMPEDLELIFEKFQRAGDRRTSTVEGTGLGLAIARQIVEHHGGRIWAVSTYGKGSTFIITLPFVKSG